MSKLFGWKGTDEGVPQRSICSPILSNIYAHYVIDTWIEDMVQPRCCGKVKLFRYGDDTIICCEFESDAKKILEVLDKRLAKFNLKLNKDKTNVVPFAKAKTQQGTKQGTFDFLGFTFYFGKSRKGYWIPKIKTVKKRFVTKVKRISEWLRRNRNKFKLKQLWKIFCAKLRGHIQYYGVSFNNRWISRFIREAKRLFFKWMNRRRQKRSMNWQKFDVFLEKHPLPAVFIRHRLF